MAVNNPEELLGCGRSSDDVWDHINTPPDAHELACTYCTAARRDLAGLADATRQLRDQDIDDDQLQASPATIDRILSIARTEVRRGRRLPLVEPGPDGLSELTVSEQAVTAVVRRVGDSLGGIQVRRCAIQALTGEQAADLAQNLPRSAVPAQRAHPTSAAARPPATVVIALRVSVDPSVSIPQVVERLRRTVIDTVDREVGIRVTRVDVAVEDVHEA